MLVMPHSILSTFHVLSAVYPNIHNGWNLRDFPTLPRVPQPLRDQPNSNSVCMYHKHTLALKSIDHHNGRLPLNSPSCKPRSPFVQNCLLVGLQSLRFAE